MTNKPLSWYLIDSNVILDVLYDKKDKYSEWSTQTLINCAEQGHLAINQIIYAEVAYAFDDLFVLENALADYKKISLPWEAGFIASKAYFAYRKNGGKRHTLMPDFYIGAHAIYAKITLVTRDKGYKHYFPGIKLINPN